MKRTMFAIVLLSLLVVLGGCVAAAVGVGTAAGVGTYSFIQGDLKVTYSVKLDQAWPAALAAMDNLKLAIDVQQMDGLGGAIKAKRADGTPVKVRLKPLGEYSTSIGVRIGHLGSKAKSERVHDAIRRQLGVS